MTQPAARLRNGDYDIDGSVLIGYSVATKAKANHGLNRWLQGQLVLGLAERWGIDELDDASDPMRAAYDLLDRVMADRPSPQRDLGDDVHTAIELHEAGQDVGDLDPVIVKHLDAYVEAKAIHGWRVIGSEITTFNRTDGWAGTIDLIIDLPGVGIVAADIKTGNVYGSMAMQLSLPGRAEGVYDAITDTTSDIPTGLRTDLGVILHVKPEGCRVIPVDLDGAYEAFMACVTLTEWTRHRERKVIGEPIKVTKLDTLHDLDDLAATERRAWVAQRIEEIRSHSAEAIRFLAEHWPPGIPTLKTNHRHTLAELDAIVEVLDRTDGRFGTPFGSPAPQPATAEESPPSPPTPWTKPDEGADIGADTAKAIIESLDAETSATLVGWLRDANRAGRSFSLSSVHSERRAAIIAAGRALVDLDDPTIRACIGLAIGTDLAPTVTIGAALGSLTISEAIALERIATAVIGGDLTYDPESESLTGEVATVLAGCLLA